MTEFTLADIAKRSDRGTSAAGQTYQRNEQSFDAHLRFKLNQLHLPSVASRHGDTTCVDPQVEDNITFTTVRTLFSVAAKALQLELHHQHDAIVQTEEKGHTFSSHCHWIPGRIEVMGKHTDYAGGNSLVCATAGRGMTMVSTYISNDQTQNQSGMKVTIVSVLPIGMEHSATATTAAPYKVESRPLVHHTIHIPNEQDKTGHPRETEAFDWTIYPTAVMHRLHQNFGLFPHSDLATNATTSDDNNINGGHVFIAVASNLPPASGLSTSSAFVTGLFLAVNSHLHLTKSKAYRRAIGEDDEEDTVFNLSTYLGNVENGRDYINEKNCAVLKGTVQGGVGTFGGSEDHAAILMGRRNELRLLSFCPTRPALFDMNSFDSDDFVPVFVTSKNSPNSQDTPTQGSVVHLSSDVTFVIAYSGAKAEKAGGADGATEASIGFNCASDLARKACDAYAASGGDNEGRPSVQTLADAIRWERGTTSTTSKNHLKGYISRRIRKGALTMNEIDLARREEYSRELAQRFEQFYDESEILVPAAARATTQERYDLLGPIVDASHFGAVNLLKNQIEETAWLPLWARGFESSLCANPLSVINTSPNELIHQSECLEARGQPRQRITALAASAFGAGFGGSCWALVDRCDALEFAQQWRSAYEDRFPSKANGGNLTREFFQTDPGPGAFCV